MLNESTLPQEATIQMAHFYLDGLRFGMLHTVPARANRDLKHHRKDIVNVVMEKDNIPLPEGYDIATQWYSDDYSVGNFVSVALRVPHELNVLQRGRRVPIEVAYLLSGHLLLGEALNFRNFRNYLRGRDLKYLPFLIGPEHFIFFLYVPTSQNEVLAGLGRFQEALLRIGTLVPKLNSILRSIYAVVRLDEVASTAPDVINPARDALRERVEAELSDFRACLGFLYQGLPGPKDSRPFYYEMFAKPSED